MTLSRPVLFVVIGLLALVSLGGVAAYLHEREKSNSVEIKIDERGLRINGR